MTGDVNPTLDAIELNEYHYKDKVSKMTPEMETLEARV